MKTKVAFVGPKNVHDAFSQMNDNWDFQSPVTSLDELENALDDDSNKTIATDTSIIIFFSQLFGTTKEEHEQFVTDVAWLAPYSAVMILATNNDEKDVIREAIKNKQNEWANAGADSDVGPYDANTPFYFVDYSDPQQTIANAISQYVKNPLANDSSRVSILKSLPDSVVTELQTQDEDEKELRDNDYNVDDSDDDDDDDSIYIPDASSDAKGKVITVTSSKGGSGKSTVSMLLGAYLAKGSQLAYSKGEIDHPLKVLIFDLDTRDGQLGFLNGHQSPTIIDIIAGGEINTNTIKQGIYHSDNMQCDFIFSSKRPRYASQIPNEFYAEVIQKLREMYDYIILDTSVNYLDPLLDSVAYPIADQIVFVTDVGISSIFGMVRWIRETTQSDDEKHVNINPNKIGIVVNKVLRDVNMPLDKIQQAVGGLKIYAMLPSMPGLITYAANTSTLDQVLNQPIINQAIYNLTNTLISPQNYKVAELPSIK
jgi:MinD-like ATPase involved in chromosome partitioning or flagellar assembly